MWNMKCDEYHTERKTGYFVLDVCYSRMNIGVLFYDCVIKISEISKECFVFLNYYICFTGFVLCLCQDLNCRLIVSSFWYLCNKYEVIVSVVGRKISVFDRCILSRGSCRLKTWLNVYLEVNSGGPDKFELSVKFSFFF